MNLDVQSEQMRLENNVLKNEMENETSVNIDELKGRIDEYLKNNLENYERNSLGQITIGKTALNDIKTIEEKLEKIDENLEIIKENTKEKNMIQKGLEDVYDTVKGSVIEKTASKVLDKLKEIYNNIMTSKIGQKVNEIVTNILSRGTEVLKNVGASTVKLIKNVIK